MKQSSRSQAGPDSTKLGREGLWVFRIVELLRGLASLRGIPQKQKQTQGITTQRLYCLSISPPLSPPYPSSPPSPSPPSRSLSNILSHSPPLSMDISSISLRIRAVWGLGDGAAESKQTHTETTGTRNKPQVKKTEIKTEPTQVAECERASFVRSPYFRTTSPLPRSTPETSHTRCQPPPAPPPRSLTRPVPVEHVVV